MRIVGKTICFKSTPDIYAMEEFGGKCWTLRHLTDEEWFEMLTTKLTHIKIACVGTDQSFKRALAHRPYNCGCVLGLNLIGFGWKEQG